MANDIFDEDGKSRQMDAHTIGQDLSLLSLEDLDERILQLEQEIVRLKQMRLEKSAAKQQAEDIFKTVKV